MFRGDVRDRDIAGKETTEGVSSNGHLMNRRDTNRNYDSTADVNDTNDAGI